MASNRPFFVIVPGASQNPSHYGHLSHLLQLAGYPTFSALLPSVGSAERITVEDDMHYIKNNMLVPVLDHEEHDVILIMHSYSGVPGSAAAAGFGKAERTAQGKKTGVIGQIFIASLLPKGGDGKNIVDVFGGNYPPHIRPDVSVLYLDSSYAISSTNLCSLRQIYFDVMTASDHCITMPLPFWQTRQGCQPWLKA